MAFDKIALKSFLQDSLTTAKDKEIPISKVIEAVTLPSDKFPQQFQTNELKLVISHLIKFIHIQSDPFIVFKSINFLLSVTQFVGPKLKDEFGQLLSDWKKKVDIMDLDDISKLAASSHDYAEELNEQSIQILLDKVEFPKEIKSWGIALEFLSREKPLPSDKAVMGGYLNFLLEKEYKDLNEMEKDQILQLIYHFIQSETKEVDLKHFLDKVVADEKHATAAEKRTVTQIVSNSLKLRIYSIPNVIPLAYVQYISSQDPSTYILELPFVLKYSLEMLKSSKDPIYISTISSLFTNPPQGNVDEQTTGGLISVFAEHRFSSENSVYSNLLQCLQLKGRDGLLHVTQESLKSIITPLMENVSISPEKRTMDSEMIKNSLNLLSTWSKSSKNFVFDHSIACKSVGELCFHSIDVSSDGGKKIPSELDLFIAYLFVFEKYIQFGTTLTALDFAKIYNLLALEGISKEGILCQQLVSFLSSTLDKMKYPKETVDWDLALMKMDIDPKGIFMASIIQNVEIDFQAANTLLLTALHFPKNDIVNLVDGIVLAAAETQLKKQNRTQLLNTIDALRNGTLAPITDDRRSRILNLIVAKNRFPFTGIWYMFIRKSEFDHNDLKIISAYVRNPWHPILLFGVAKFFEGVKEKGDCYENGYIDLFDIHKSFLIRFPVDLLRGYGFKWTEHVWSLWPIMWSAYVLFALEYKPRDENRIKLGVQLLSHVPYKHGSKTELNINEWDRIKILLDEILKDQATNQDIKTIIKKIYACIT